MPSEILVSHDLSDAPEYQRREPETTVLYRVVQRNLETFLASARDQGRVATGPRAGQRLLRLGDRIDVEDAETITGLRCASVQGFSLHADVCVPARDRARLERLSRYAARPPIATDRLSELPDGRILYRLRHRWRDGTTRVVFDPLDLVARLAALVPPPRANMVRYHGILAPCASWRDLVVRDRDGVSWSARPPPRCPCKAGPSQEGAPPQPTTTERAGAGMPARSRGPPAPGQSAETATTLSHEDRLSPGRAPLRERRLPWSDLLHRVFAVDAFRCDRCGGRMRILAAIDGPDVIRGILDCLGLNSRAPPLTPAPPPGPTDLELGFREPWPSDEPDDGG